MWARMHHWLRTRRRRHARAVPPQVMTALVDINMLSLNVLEARWLLRHGAPLTDADMQAITHFLETANTCLAETPAVSAPAHRWRTLQTRTRVLNAEFDRLRSRVMDDGYRARQV